MPSMNAWTEHRSDDMRRLLSFLGLDNMALNQFPLFFHCLPSTFKLWPSIYSSFRSFSSRSLFPSLRPSLGLYCRQSFFPPLFPSLRLSFPQSLHPSFYVFLLVVPSFFSEC